MNDEDRNTLIMAVTHGVSAIVGFIIAAAILGMPVDWLVLLEKVGHLPSLGRPGPGCQRYFSTHLLLQLRQNEEWLDKAVAIVRKGFKGKNLASYSSKRSSQDMRQP